MTGLILGPSGSGKSAYAEELAVRLSTGILYYIATMIPYGEEGQSRVERHLKQRSSMGFITVEQPYRLSEINLAPDAAVLLEDASNLMSNALFCGDGNGDVNSVFDDITALCGSCRDTVIVSIDGLSAQPEYDEGTRAFIESLNWLNARLAGFVDLVVMMRDGKPVIRKGSAYALDK